jgi:hypothetical protein
VQFDWYSYIWYLNYPQDIGKPKRRIGRRIGVAENVRSTPCHYILPKSCRQIALSSVTTVSKDELLQPEVKEQAKKFDEIIDAKIENKQSDDNVIEEFSDIPQIPADIFKGDDPDDIEAVETGMPEADD